MHYLYILRTINNSLYVGVTSNLEQRICAHNLGRGAEWTKAHKAATLVYFEQHGDLSSARKREIQIKKWSRSKKEALISGNLDQLKILSKSRKDSDT